MHGHTSSASSKFFLRSKRLMDRNTVAAPVGTPSSPATSPTVRSKAEQSKLGYRTPGVSFKDLKVRAYVAAVNLLLTYRPQYALAQRAEQEG